jgi:hypothetical protein
MKLRLFLRLSCPFLLGLLSTCNSQRLDPPPVQESSAQVATSVVRIRSGQSFTASCLIVETGATVEWRNLTPGTSLSVVNMDPPYELSSPALREPYNLVPPELSDECVLRSPDGCLAAVPFSFWRHTFLTPGVFDYHDASGATATSQSEYGMPPGPSSTSAATGTVCVRSAAGSTECDQVCCTGAVAGECATGVSCVAGRCGGVS